MMQKLTIVAALAGFKMTDCGRRCSSVFPGWSDHRGRQGVEFSTTIGGYSLKRKCRLKDMIINGEPAL